jgi:hypothetical protein
VRLEGLGKLKKSTSSGIRSRDLPACSVVPQSTTLPRTGYSSHILNTGHTYGTITDKMDIIRKLKEGK